MVQRQLILLSFFLFCTNSCIKGDDSIITEMVKLSVDFPTYTNIIDANNNIVRFRSFDKDIYRLPFDTIRQSLKDDEIELELFALPIGDGTVGIYHFLCSCSV